VLNIAVSQGIVKWLNVPLWLNVPYGSTSP